MAGQVSAEMAGPVSAEMAEAIAHLDEHGWCVCRGVVGAAVAADARAMVDAHLGPPCKDIAMHDNQDAARTAGVVWGQKNGERGPALTSREGGPTHLEAEEYGPNPRTSTVAAVA
jgi:hypothetical protein